MWEMCFTDIGDEEVCAKDIIAEESRVNLQKLSIVAEGYHWTEGLLFRTRLDVMGDSIEQLCLPLPYRHRCLSLAHERFGHARRNKICIQIKRGFYWPSMTADVNRHWKSCTTCQRHTKSMPKRLPMQEREVVCVLSERVCIDLGPFPTVRGGYRFLLTYIDMAIRWPGAIQLRKTTTRILIDQLTLIFSRIGFPSTLISDNGPQYMGKLFKRFLNKGINHIRASPYHPKGNGVIKRIHHTLNAVIAKCKDAKGNWAQLVPMSLYFLWCMPNRSAGLSPFLLKHGWEPSTPLQLLYKGWVQQYL